MRYRKLSPTGDFVFGQGSTEFLVNTPETVGQAVLTRLKLVRGEWFLDLGAGTPWRTEILGENTQDTYDIALREAILDTEGVVQIDSYASVLDGNTRELRVVAEITTVYGRITLNEVL